MDISLIIPAFIAGLITFLAPCTLPLVPGYLGFISGVSSQDLSDPEKVKKLRWKIFSNGTFFILGFSVIFIVLGTLIGLLGSTLAPYQIWLNRIGGAFIVFFGLLLLNVIKLPFLHLDRRIKIPAWLERGKPTSSLVIGLSFGAGWTPCVGPVLGAILALASTSGTVLQSTLLLSVFSLGLAVPFLAVALGIGSATQYIQKFSKYLNAISFIGGLFLIFLGVMLFIGRLSLLLSWGFQVMRFFGIDAYEEVLLRFL
ncbi:sulfite exporter TauE/SafE family protein [Candidatus Wolfebacteria bacterium]|nr:sulfite exporter TauE/SafE family protein [Candidatus Wolfebacteria bacterium]